MRRTRAIRPAVEPLEGRAPTTGLHADLSPPAPPPAFPPAPPPKPPSKPPSASGILLIAAVYSPSTGLLAVTGSYSHVPKSPALYEAIVSFPGTRPQLAYVTIASPGIDRFAAVFEVGKLAPGSYKITVEGFTALAGGPTVSVVSASNTLTVPR